MDGIDAPGGINGYVYAGNNQVMSAGDDATIDSDVELVPYSNVKLKTWWDKVFAWWNNAAWWIKALIGVAFIAILWGLSKLTAGTASACFFGSVLSGAIQGAVIGAMSGAIMNGIFALINQENFWTSMLEGFGEGLLDGAISGAIFGAISWANNPACFIAGTLVLAKEGKKAIENIVPGDEVLAYDEQSGDMQYKKVARVFRNTTDKWYHLTVDGEEIVCTAGHPFYVLNADEKRNIVRYEGANSNKKGKWIAAKELEISDKLLLANGKYAIIDSIEVELLESPEVTYNFEVEDFHTYFVGEGICVHNACGNKTITGPKDVGTYKNVRIDVETGGSGKINIHMHAKDLPKMYYKNGTFPTAPKKLRDSNFVINGIKQAIDFIKKLRK